MKTNLSKLQKQNAAKRIFQILLLILLSVSLAAGFRLVKTGLLKPGTIGTALQSNAPEHEEPGMPEDGMPYWFQYEPSIADIFYGEGPIRETGCGPTALAMILQDLGLENVSIKEAAAYADANGYYQPGAGTMWAFFTDYAQANGIEAYQTVASEESLLEELRAGHDLLFSMGPGDFTRSGHIVAAKGINEEGKTNVHDPNSKKNSRPWLITDLLVQANAVFAYRLPN